LKYLLDQRLSTIS
jgi:hypothetical protein